MSHLNRYEQLVKENADKLPGDVTLDPVTLMHGLIDVLPDLEGRISDESYAVVVGVAACLLKASVQLCKGELQVMNPAVYSPFVSSDEH